MPSPSRGRMRIAEHHQKLEETREDSSLQFQKEHFDFRLLASRCGAINFCCFESPSLWFLRFSHPGRGTQLATGTPQWDTGWAWGEAVTLQELVHWEGSHLSIQLTRASGIFSSPVVYNHLPDD